MRIHLPFKWIFPIVMLLPLCGCQTVYYGTMDKMGVHKRDILTDRVKDARDSQEDAKNQFQNALEQFTALVEVKGGDLQDKYDKLSRAFERSETRAQTVRDRIAAVDDVSRALFKEWEKELGQYTSKSLRHSSEQQLASTRERYTELIGAMRKAESQMDPVLNAFRDQVLFLKHNLNARAIASLEDEVDTIGSDIADLIRDMEQSIQEADRFIQSMSGS